MLRECITYPLGAMIVYGEHGWSIKYANISKSGHRNCRTLNYLHLEVYNGFFPSAKRPKVRNSFSHWGPNSMIYITTFAILAVH